MDSLLDFTDKVVLITGAASGFGKQLAIDFSARGAKLVIGDLNIEGLNAVAETLAGPVTVIKCDVSKEDECKAMVDAAIENYGQLDIAINNAGISHGYIPLHQMTDEIMDLQFDINIKGVVYGMKHQIEAMMPKGDGVILNVSSMAGLGGAPNISAYSAAKHAVIGLTKTAAVEYARKGIRVNAVCPFFTLTPMVADGELIGDTKESTQEILARSCPMKRLGQPVEITNVMLMMCSPGNSFMNGQCIAVDGGMSAM
ncbi:glucose 1-dehydrogenase [Oceaniserpentilla sp. 4NH20-0058]|uniref:SDR family NAD(P)-dependent oxidoreductase n=1 Tax=Oceaniserpentilla sp. 4NH20-0058 TaxID=3127660 RepID=UPI00310C746B